MPEFTFKDILLLKDMLAFVACLAQFTDRSIDGHSRAEIHAVWTKVTDWADAVRPPAPEE